jgi:hypothetical protein
VKKFLEKIDLTGCALIALWFTFAFLCMSMPHRYESPRDPEEQRIEQLRREWKPAPHDLSPNDEPQKEV